MIEIRNFLRRKDGTFEPLLASSDPPEDPLYVEGAMELVIDGVEHGLGAGGSLGAQVLHQFRPLRTSAAPRSHGTRSAC
ncbi:hypothetical protein [Amycolatopsis sp. NPDC006125]|uniref:hypothetical protein n=1 Tax=Amycolatopsis sp. NPDC006125 TaxID=3156730 RepID=UPI0033AEA6C4